VQGLRIRVLGGLQVEDLDAAALGSRKARSLMKRLALARGQAVPVDQLVDGLWGNSPPARPAEQVAVLVSRLRGVLGADRLPRDDVGYRLVADWLDVDALAELVEEATRRLAAGETAAARAAAGAALALARGEVLPDELDAEWAEVDRARAHRLLAQARTVAAEAALAAGDAAAAAEAAGAALDHDPYDEAALRVQMRALAATGRPASALAAYARLRERLSEDLGVDPAPETETLHTALLLGDAPVVPAVAGDHHAAPTAAPVSLPGRDGALAALDAALAQGGVASVEAEAGMGKTRLLDTWAARTASGGTTVLRGRFEELARSLPLQGVMDAIDLHLRGLEPDAAAAVLGAEGDVLAPLLGRLPAGASTVGALIGQASGEALLFGAIHAVLGRIAGRGPAALLLDDVHLAGPITFEWLHFVARRGLPPGAVVVVARRPEEGPPVPARVVALNPLSVGDAAEVVGEERAAVLHARSAGHPLFLVELAAAGDDDALPTSIRDAVAAQCARAGEAADTLRASAVLGTDIDLDLLAAAVGRPPVELLAHLEEGVRRRVLVEHGDGFAFSHGLVRDALAADTSASRRALLHREASRALAARSSPDPRAVAFHARLGGDDATAAAALVDAAAIAADHYDSAEAERLASEAIDLADSARARLARARVRIVRGEYQRAIDDAQEARRLGAGAEALELIAWSAHFLKDDATAVEVGEEGARIAVDQQVRASCLTVSGWSRATGGDVKTAAPQLEQAYAMATGQTRTMAAAWLGGLVILQGRPDEGLSLISPLLTMGVGSLHSQPLTYAHMLGAIAFGYQGRPVEALASVDHLEAETARTGSPRFAGRADNIRGWILRTLGATSEADELNRHALEVSELGALTEPLSHAHLDLATGAVLRGELDEAVDHLDAVDAIQHLPHSLRWRHRLRSRLLRTRVAMANQAWDDAEADAAGAITAATELSATRQILLAQLLQAEARLRRGDAVDHAGIEALLEQLPASAGLEAWRITADLADAGSIDRWRALAQRRAADLAARAGPYRATVETAAAARFS
jgi:DNA-binding SARP family transcriptional activator